MKKIFFIAIFILQLTVVFAQHMPLGINYQAVARDNNGSELRNTNLNVRISITERDATGPVEYSETHAVTTDMFGLFKLIIGEGSYYTGKVQEFSEINWGSDAHFLKVEVDFGQGFISMGSMQFLAVPYALYAANAGDVSGDDLDKDPENELQTLSLQNRVLSISNGNSVTLGMDVVNDADADPENEIQDLYLDEHRLYLTKDPTADPIDLSIYLDNTDEQKLSKSGNTISITNGGSVDIDTDPSNELQKISKDGYWIKLSRDGDSVTIKPDVIAFRAKRPTGDQILGLETKPLPFIQSIFDTHNAFSYSLGLFEVPLGGAGLYHFEISFDYRSGDKTILIYKNGVEEETIYEGSSITGIKTYSFIYNLEDGDSVQIMLYNSADYQEPIGSASFFGYRIH